MQNNFISAHIHLCFIKTNIKTAKPIEVWATVMVREKDEKTVIGENEPRLSTVKPIE